MNTKGIKKKILIIDDEPDVARTLSDYLEFVGYQVSIARDGAEGLETCRKGSLDLVLLDVIMPKMSGYDVCRQLKGDPRTREIPVILLTSKAQERDKAFGRETGADNYMTKPYEMSELLKLIQKHLSKSP